MGGARSGPLSGLARCPVDETTTVHLAAAAAVIAERDGLTEREASILERVILGLDNEQIGADLGISRATVNNIVNGKWRPRPRRDPPTSEAPIARTVPKYRCGGCGAMVNLDPCLLCAVRRDKDAERQRAKAQPNPGSRR